MKYFGSKISENMAETPEGFLLCLNVPIGRLGTMDYGKNEVPVDAGPDGIVKISREEEELFSPATIASFQGKPLTIRHPDEFVNPENWSELAKGTMQNVRRGSGEFKDDLVCDLLITDEEAISLVKSGMRELSCGYEAKYTQTGEGKGKQTNIVGNHLALVEEGRAGSGYAVRDHKGVDSMKDKKYLERLRKLLTGKTVDEASFEKAAKDAESEPTANEPAKMSDEMKGAMDEMVSGFKKICDDMIEKLQGKKSEDEDPEKEKKGEDAEENPLEERLKKLEEAVAKLLESKDSEEEKESEDEKEEKEEKEEKSEDEESEVIEDERADDEEAEDEEYEATGDEKVLAEILSPGIKITKDVKSKALKAAYATKDGKRVIDAINGGKKPAFDKPEQVAMLFTAAANILRAERVTDLSQTRKWRQSTDYKSTLDQEGHMTPEKMNKLNEEKYKLTK